MSEAMKSFTVTGELEIWIEKATRAENAWN